MNDSPVFVMAGYLAPAEAWESFSDEWDAALKEAKPKRLDYFKMSEAWSRTGQFEGWTIAQRDAQLKLLIEIINRHAIASVIFIVPTASWRRHFVGKLIRSYHNRPYYFAFHGIMSALVKYLHYKQINDKIEFVFDNEGCEPTQEILASFEGWANLAPAHLKKYIGARPIFCDDYLVKPLQAADLIAWHVRRVFHEAAKGKKDTTVTVIAAEVFIGVEQIKCLWNDADIKDAVDAIVLSDRLLQCLGTTMTLPDPSSFSWDV